MSEQLKRGSKVEAKNKFERKRYQSSPQEEGPSPQVKLNEMLTVALAYLNNGKSDLELEVRFGTKGIRQITKQDYDNVIQKLLSLDFEQDEKYESYILRCIGEYTDPNTGAVKPSNIRTELNGLETIKHFSVQVLTKNIKMLHKQNQNLISL